MKQYHPEECLKEGERFCNLEIPCCTGLKCVTSPILLPPPINPPICVSNATGNFTRKCKYTW